MNATNSTSTTNSNFTTTNTTINSTGKHGTLNVNNISADFESTLPPRKRAKTREEKEQRRIERILRNRKAAHQSREKKRLHLQFLIKKCDLMEQILSKIDNIDQYLINDNDQILYNEYCSMKGSNDFTKIVESSVKKTAHAANASDSVNSNNIKKDIQSVDTNRKTVQINSNSDTVSPPSTMMSPTSSVEGSNTTANTQDNGQNHVELMSMQNGKQSNTHWDLQLTVDELTPNSSSSMSIVDDEMLFENQVSAAAKTMFDDVEVKAEEPAIAFSEEYYTSHYDSSINAYNAMSFELQVSDEFLEFEDNHVSLMLSEPLV